jgi:hypothetical protein
VSPGKNALAFVRAYSNGTGTSMTKYVGRHRKDALEKEGPDPAQEWQHAQTVTVLPAETMVMPAGDDTVTMAGPDEQEDTGDKDPEPGEPVRQVPGEKEPDPRV